MPGGDSARGSETAVLGVAGVLTGEDVAVGEGFWGDVGAAGDVGGRRTRTVRFDLSLL